MKKSKPSKGDSESDRNDAGSDIENEVDALFKLPLSEFTGARNDLAATLKRGGRPDDANSVKALAKPSASAWVVNQLYWIHRAEFDRLLAAGRGIGQAQASGKMADMRGLLDARREALTQLSELASALLRDAGHSPTPDAIHRVTTTLEAVSAYASLPDGPILGRLTRDLDPPGFDSLASFLAGAVAAKAKEEPARVAPAQEEKSSGGTATHKKAPIPADIEKQNKFEEALQARIAAARASLQDAERLLDEATVKSGQMGAAREKAHTEANEAETELQELEERLRTAKVAAREAVERLQSLTKEAKDAAKAAEDANRNVEKASKELESLLR